MSLNSVDVWNIPFSPFKSKSLLGSLWGANKDSSCIVSNIGFSLSWVASFPKLKNSGWFPSKLKRELGPSRFEANIESCCKVESTPKSNCGPGCPSKSW